MTKEAVPKNAAPKKAAPTKAALKKPTAKFGGKKAVRQPVGVPKPVAKKVALKKVAAKATTAMPKKVAAKMPFSFKRGAGPDEQTTQAAVGTNRR